MYKVMGNVAIGNHISGNNSNSAKQTSTASSLSQSASLKADQNVVLSLGRVIQILNFVLDVRLDYRVTAVLSTFKAEFETLGTQSSLADKEFSVINQRADELTKESIRLDLDHSGGKMFLRVIFLLILHDDPPLASGALKLLFRHFNQRQELVDAMKNVQLLISHSNVDQYKQIKADVEDLRRLTEESELWIPVPVAETQEEEKMRRKFLEDNLKRAGIQRKDSVLSFRDDSEFLKTPKNIKTVDFGRLEQESSKINLAYKKDLYKIQRAIFLIKTIILRNP